MDGGEVEVGVEPRRSGIGVGPPPTVPWLVDTAECMAWMRFCLERGEVLEGVEGLGGEEFSLGAEVRTMTLCSWGLVGKGNGLSVVKDWAWCSK